MDNAVMESFSAIFTHWVLLVPIFSLFILLIFTAVLKATEDETGQAFFCGFLFLILLFSSAKVFKSMDNIDFDYKYCIHIHEDNYRANYFRFRD